MHLAAVVRRAVPDDAPELVRLRHAMFREMVRAGVGAHPAVVEETSWYPAADRAFRDGIGRGRLAAFVVDAPTPDDPAGEGARGSRGGGGRSLVASSVVTLDERLPGPGFPAGLGAHLSTVFVEPAHRRRGLARAVVEASVTWCDEVGAEIVDLNATPDAVGLYRSLGFTEPRAVALRRVPPSP